MQSATNTNKLILHRGKDNSYGVDTIMQFLDKHDVEYFYNKTLNDIQFQFIIPTLHAYCIIEYRDISHYKPQNYKYTKRKDAIEELLEKRKHDEKVEQFCERFSFPLLIVSYSDFEIDKLVDSFLLANL